MVPRICSFRLPLPTRQTGAGPSALRTVPAMANVSDCGVRHARGRGVRHARGFKPKGNHDESTKDRPSTQCIPSSTGSDGALVRCREYGCGGSGRRAHDAKHLDHGSQQQHPCARLDQPLQQFQPAVGERRRARGIPGAHAGAVGTDSRRLHPRHHVGGVTPGHCGCCGQYGARPQQPRRHLQ
jgi:hypothetical protein